MSNPLTKQSHDTSSLSALPQVELGTGFVERSAKLCAIVSEIRPALLGLGSRVIAANEKSPFTSIISDDVSGRFVARFLRDMLKPANDLPILCAWVGATVDSRKIGGNLDRLAHYRDVIGERPLIATEAIHNGVTCTALARWLKTLDREISPTIAALAISQSRTLSSHATIRQIRQAGATEVIVGNHLTPELQIPFVGNPMQSGMVKLPASEGSALRSWATAATYDLTKLGRQRLINLGRSMIKDIAREARDTASSPQ